MVLLGSVHQKKWVDFSIYEKLDFYNAIIC